MGNTFETALDRGVAALGLEIGSRERDAFARYAELLRDANTRTNLTRITDPAEIAVKHFADSLSVLRAVPDLASGASVADIGTGAGFPGLPLKIVRPDLDVALIDSLGKRLTFLESVVADLGLSGVSLVHARAEDIGRDPAHRNRHDLVVARAVAALPTLLEWCSPLVRPEVGRFVAMKSGDSDAERDASARARTALGVRLENDVALTLPSTDPDDPEPLRRRLYVFSKMRPTQAAFPRRPAEIKAKPL